MVNVYSTDDAQRQHELVGHEDTVHRVIFSPDSQRRVTAIREAVADSIPPQMTVIR